MPLSRDVIVDDYYEARVATKYTYSPVEGTSYTTTAYDNENYKLEYIQGAGGVQDSQLYIVMDATIDGDWDSATRPLIMPEY